MKDSQEPNEKGMGVLHPLVLIVFGVVFGALGVIGVQRHRAEFPFGRRDVRVGDVENEFRYSYGLRSYITATGGIIFAVGGILQLVL